MDHFHIDTPPTKLKSAVLGRESSKKKATPESRSCHKCGYSWKAGQHGGHDCSVLLLEKIAKLEMKLSPRFWGQAEHYAWHRAIPNMQKAFDDLKEAKEEGS
jgi:hypothetical protein